MAFLKNVLFKVVLLILAVGGPLAVDYFTADRTGPYELSLGEPYLVSTDLYNVPDTRVSYVTMGDTPTALFVSADVEGVRLDMSFDGELDVWQPRPMIFPDQTMNDRGYYQGYRTPGLVFKTPNGQFCALVHTEFWQDEVDNFPYAAEIQAMCGNDLFDGFGDPVTILTGLSNTTIDPTKATGVGQPCGIVIDEFLYVYFTNWDAGLDAIHVARAPIDEIMNPSAWLKYQDGTFSSEGLGGASSAVVRPQSTTDHYAAICSVSWNTYLNKYLMSYETEVGVYFTTSDDGLTWGDHKQIVDFTTRFNTDSDWASYFTPLSFDTGNQFVTGQSGVLVFRRMINKISLNTMYAMSFSFS